jgi:Domain of Unknown Function (DUF349)
MSFLDRLRPQPRWKHADPAVRAAAVAEMPADSEHQQIIAELAGTDPDVRVRQAALGRLDSVVELVALVGREGNDDLRREISERLVAIASSASDGDGDAALALDGLSDQRQLAAVAKSSPHDTVRTAALGRIHDPRVLSSVARQATDASVALEAVNRVADAAELTSIASRTEHKDAGIAALERAAAAAASEGNLRELLDGVAARAKNKGVVKRARAMIQEIEEAEAAKRAAQEAWQQRVAAVMARVEALTATPGAADATDRLNQSEREWRELGTAGGFEIDHDTVTRFSTLLSEARTAIAAREREQAELRAEAERQAAIRTVRIALCERVEALRGEDAAEEVAKARAEWEGLPGPGEQEQEDREFRAKFEEVCRRALERHENSLLLHKTYARLDELAAEAERLAAEADLPEHSWQAVVTEWRTLHPRADGLDPAIAERFTAAEAAVQAREDERRAAAEKSLRQQIQRLDQLIERVQKRAPAEDLTLREADRAARELRAVLDAPPQLEEREQQPLMERLRATLNVLSPRLHELREMDEWKRFANAAVQEELIAKTEALRTRFGFDAEEGPTPENVEKATRELHDIQERWKQVAEAPRAQAQALWHRYRQAADPIQVKAREFFAHRAEERGDNLQKKMALIERAEALADSTDWIRTSEELKKLQAEWQQIGAVPRQETKETWKRFREACDKFFTRRNADLAERKETWAANLAKKEALCARAEELASSRDWDRTAAEIRRMQAEWKTIGPVRRNKSDAIWTRFRAACDAFFERYKRRDEIELEAKQADREGLVQELESLMPAASADGGEGALADPSAATEQPGDLLDRVRSLRTRWNQTTPVVRHGADPLSGRFVDALERLLTQYPDAFRGTELDVEASRQKMEKLCARVESFVAEAAATPAGSSKALAEMLREALAANTIGGRAGEESKWRAMAEEVRQAQSAWSRLVPVPGETGRQMSDRFHKACNRFFDQFRRKVPPQQQRGRPVAARG